MSDEKKVLKHIKKRIDKYSEKDKKITVTNEVNLEISQFYQEDDGTIELTSKSLKIKDNDITYEIFSNGIVLKIEEHSKEAYGATHTKPHCTPNL
ncbi:hypothetical protein KQY27_08360 [Methanobrevibacter sp. TMH8]|uniref:hypothetical protein n=1 Tax=Methanobrevibacter sp. TMH8 TaxID=2848611 RepID=UPI001CCEA3E1|nr:hypothetical protein [Methanobrevibacter sp. TMH8]MBZ9571557.1 hypothetical protein [Methanobrevibacter sp. TMH8]